MTTCYLSPIGNSPQTSTSGAPLSGGSITTYQAGTSTLVATYTDSSGVTPQANPITLNTYGLPNSPIWLTKGQSYKLIIKDSLGNTIRTIDTVTGINDPTALGISFGSDGTFDFRNRFRNGNFAINQRVVSGTVTLAAGAYGHDGWKAGSGGCTYTFIASGADTVITISAGSLLQIVDGENVEGGVYSLANRGTAQARIAVNGGSTSGGYAPATTTAPLQSASATAGQSVTVEFATGTLDRVQLEPGTVATSFERRPLAVEFSICQRRLQFIGFGIAQNVTSGNTYGGTVVFPMMSAIPTWTNVSQHTNTSFQSTPNLVDVWAANILDWTAIASASSFGRVSYYGRLSTES